MVLMSVYKFPVYTVMRLCNMDCLYTEGQHTLTITPHEDLKGLPRRYQDFIRERHHEPGEGDEALVRLRRIADWKIAQNPDSGLIQDLMWLLGGREEGGERYAEAQAWQRAQRGTFAGRRA